MYTYKLNQLLLWNFMLYIAKPKALVIDYIVFYHVQILDLTNSENAPKLLHQPDSIGKTPLMLAAQNGQLE